MQSQYVLAFFGPAYPTTSHRPYFFQRISRVLQCRGGSLGADDTVPLSSTSHIIRIAIVALWRWWCQGGSWISLSRAGPAAVISLIRWSIMFFITAASLHSSPLTVTSTYPGPKDLCRNMTFIFISVMFQSDLSVIILLHLGSCPNKRHKASVSSSKFVSSFGAASPSINSGPASAVGGAMASTASRSA